MTKIIAVEICNPDLVVSQAEVLSCVQARPRATSREVAWYRRFLSDHGIERRHFALDDLSVLYTETGDQAIERFQKAAVQLGSRAAQKALHAAPLTPKDLNGLIVATCTGYLCPGLTSYLSEALGLEPHVDTLDLTGFGCGAALPAMRAGHQFLSAHPDSVVAVVCVEICSAAVSWGEEIDLILSNSVFGDGAACAILTNRDGFSGPSVLDFESLTWPQYRDDLRFRNRDSRLRNVVSLRVPALAARAVTELYLKLSSRVREGIDHMAIHPGGRKVLDEIEAQIPVLKDKLSCARRILSRFGNMSSPSVLYVLNEMLDQEEMEEGEPVLLFSFGAGFSAFGATLRYEPMGRLGHQKAEVSLEKQ